MIILDDDYELVPKREILELKKQIQELKQDPLGQASGSGFYSSIEALNTNLSKMINIFKQASEEMKLEERESQIISQKIEPILEKIDEIHEDNQAIAKAILNLSDDMKELKEQLERNSAPQMSLPPRPQPRMVMPPPEQGPPMPQSAPVPQNDQKFFNWK